MKILKYSYNDVNFKMDEIIFHQLNLLVGISGSGKTRLLNTLFNLGKSASLSEIKTTGDWKIEFKIGEIVYRWELLCENGETEKGIITYELVKNLTHNLDIVSRTKNKFMFNGEKLPQLKASETSLSILRKESIIEPIHKAFGSILMRNFSHDHLDDNYSKYMPISDSIKKIINSNKNEFVKLFNLGASLHILLHTLKIKDKKRFDLFCDFLTDIFPNIVDVDLKDLTYFNADVPFSETPAFCIKEKNVSDWIQFKFLSSGMQKTVTIMVDTLLIDHKWIYLIDEYENSLGPTIIDFFNNWTEYIDSKNQFIITSHHPFVINNIPIDNWIVCKRDGINLDFVYGDKLKEVVGKSRHTAYTKLLNSPLLGNFLGQEN